MSRHSYGGRWTCWVCGATEKKDGGFLTTCGLVVYNHLRGHARTGLLRPSTWREKERGEGPFMPTEAGEQFMAARALAQAQAGAGSEGGEAQ